MAQEDIVYEVFAEALLENFLTPISISQYVKYFHSRYKTQRKLVMSNRNIDLEVLL